MEKCSDDLERTVGLGKRFVLREFWSMFLLIIWSTWWGGLSFYAIVVVPIGTEIIGSVEQGFITQQVTWWHNWILAFLVACLGIEALCRRSKLLFAVVASLLVVDLILFIDHAYLTSQMDFVRKSVLSRFYSQHGFYLWITAAEWSVGIAIPFVLRLTTNETAARSEQREK